MLFYTAKMIAPLILLFTLFTFVNGNECAPCLCDSSDDVILCAGYNLILFPELPRKVRIRY